jgi:hypothetical protein
MPIIQDKPSAPPKQLPSAPIIESPLAKTVIIDNMSRTDRNHGIERYRNQRKNEQDRKRLNHRKPPLFTFV